MDVFDGMGGWEAKIGECESGRTARMYDALGAQSDPRLSSSKPSQMLRKGLRTRVEARPHTVEEPIRMVSSHVGIAT